MIVTNNHDMYAKVVTYCNVQYDGVEQNKVSLTQQEICELRAGKIVLEPLRVDITPAKVSRRPEPVHNCDILCTIRPRMTRL